MASPARFELTAPGLGILCSILLSYGDTQRNQFVSLIPRLVSYTQSRYRLTSEGSTSLVVKSGRSTLPATDPLIPKHSRGVQAATVPAATHRVSARWNRASG